MFVTVSLAAFTIAQHDYLDDGAPLHHRIIFAIVSSGRFGFAVDSNLHLHDVVYVQNDVHAGGSAHTELAKSTADLYIRSLRSC